MSEGPDRVITRARVLTRGAAALSVFLGATVLFGWASNTRLLVTAFTSHIAVPLDTAIALVLGGLALWCDDRRNHHRLYVPVRTFCASGVCLIGALTLTADVIGRILHIASLQHGVVEALAGPLSHGLYPAPSTAIALSGLGLAIAALDTKGLRTRWITPACALTSGAIALVALTAHAYGAKTSHGLPSVLPNLGMALPTSLSLLLLVAGVLAARPTRGWMGPVSSGGPGGVMARRMLPAAVALPLAMGLLGSMSARARLQDAPSAFALFATASMFAMAGLLLGTARSLDRMDAARRAAERRRSEMLDRERAALAAAETERARLQTVFDSAAQGIAFVDARGRALLNPVAQRTLVGSTSGQTTAREQVLPRLFAPDGKPLALDEMPSSRALRGETVTDVELIAAQPNGKRSILMVSATPIRDSDNAVRGAVVTFQDITVRKELERSREEYVALISHDLRAPLTAVSLHAQLLRKILCKRNEPTEMTHVEAMAHNADRMKGMIQDLLETAQLEEGRLLMHFENGDLAALVERVLEQVLAPDDRRRVRLEITGASLPVECDRARIERVVTNLVGNALKYSEPGTPVIVRLGAREGFAHLEVLDQGAGISADDIPRLFQKYARGGGKKPDGLGLGLYISRLIVEAHRGAIDATSRVGTGSVFRFRLPLAAVTSPSRAPDAPRVPTALASDRESPAL